LQKTNLKLGSIKLLPIGSKKKGFRHQKRKARCKDWSFLSPSRCLMLNMGEKKSRCKHCNVYNKIIYEGGFLRSILNLDLLNFFEWDQRRKALGIKIIYEGSKKKGFRHQNNI
jgi:hypothetical protein